MAKLVVHAPGEPVTELDLPPGLHQIGRSPEAQFQINHPSVSGAHCQIEVLADGATVKDLGSTNGTWINGRRIIETPLAPGQRLRLGEVDVVFDPPPARATVARLAGPPVPPPLPPDGTAPLAVPLPLPLRAAAEAENYFQLIPGAFVYPFKHWGVLPLAVGSVVFLAFNVLPRLQVVAAALLASGGHDRGFSLFFRVAFAGTGFGIGTIFNALCTGYVFLFMQNILSASANGEERMPLYPLFESWWDDGVAPYLRLLCLVGGCLAPAVLCRSFLGPDVRWLTLLLGLAGFGYFSMALMAVSVCDSIWAMTPQIVLPSICRVPAEYGVYCVLFFVLTFVTFFSARLLEEIPFGLIEFSIYLRLAVEFIFLYVSAVEMRLLGLLFRTGRKRLAWKI